MPGLLKIGHTIKAIDERASELSSATGIPTPFVVEAFFEVDQPKVLEKEIHSVLSAFRVRKRREFFKIERLAAIDTIAPMCGTGPRSRAKHAPKKSPNYHNPRWLTPEQLEFNGIRKELWNKRKAAFERKSLSNPSVATPPQTIPERLMTFFLGNQQERINGALLSRAQDVIVPLGGSLIRRYDNKVYRLNAGRHSVAYIDISSAIDLRPDRIRAILSELQREEREIFEKAREEFEFKHNEGRIRPRSPREDITEKRCERLRRWHERQ